MFSSRNSQLSVIVLIAVTSAILFNYGPASAATILSHPMSKRSFFDIQCKGTFDKSIFARLNRVCEDCYHLYRDAELHNLCRSDCFSSMFFKGCVKALLEEHDQYQEMIEILGGK